MHPPNDGLGAFAAGVDDVGKAKKEVLSRLEIIDGDELIETGACTESALATTSKDDDLDAPVFPCFGDGKSQLGEKVARKGVMRRVEEFDFSYS